MQAAIRPPRPTIYMSAHIGYCRNCRHAAVSSSSSRQLRKPRGLPREAFRPATSPSGLTLSTRTRGQLYCSCTIGQACFRKRSRYHLLCRPWIQT